RENTAMEDDASLEDLSLLPRGATIPAGETWVGSPGQKAASETQYSVRDSEAQNTEHSSRFTFHVSRPALRGRFAYGLLHALGLLIFPVLVVAALFPGIVVMNKLNYLDPYYWYLLLAPLVGLSFIVLLALEIAAIKWLLLGKVRPGRYPLHSFFYLRKWFV